MSNDAPYFLWSEDDQVTEGELREKLRSVDEAERILWLGRVMREAKFEDVWKFTSVEAVLKDWLSVQRHLGRRRAFWQFTLEGWRKLGLIAELPVPPIVSLEVDRIWIFMGAGAQFPAGVFSSRAHAERWISGNGLTGTLTAYPVDVAVYDWAISNEVFKPKRDDQRTPRFIQRFSSASMEHYHYENGDIPA